MKEELQSIGLTPNEIIIYQTLVKLGGSSAAGDIIKLANLHRNIVYDALSRLGNTGLVQEIEKNKKKFFVLKDPGSLMFRFKKQIASTHAIAKVVASLPLSASNEVTVYEGTQAWQEAWQKMMEVIKPGTVFYTLGMAGDAWVDLMGKTFIQYESWALKNKIKNKIVSQTKLKDQIEAHQNIAFRDISYIDIDLPPLTTIEIFHDRCFFEIYDNPAILIEVKSLSLAKSLGAYALLLWSQKRK